MFTESDLRLFEQRGISVKDVEQQLSMLSNGFPDLRIVAPATVKNRGVRRLSVDEQQHYIDVWQSYVEEGHTICKFVPASGVASRMFKDLFTFLNAPDDAPVPASVKEVIDSLPKFAFADLLEGRQGKAAVKYLLEELGFGNMPKGLLPFHTYPKEKRTAAEEHLIEGTRVLNNKNTPVCIHFTVSHQHLPLFRNHLATVLPKLQSRLEVTFNISFSEQSPATDTIAANPDGTPFRNPDGSLLFRPGGHGALINNLEKTDAEVVFVKNIDNVVPDWLKPTTIRWKQILGGVLVEEMAIGGRNRPIRVCGVVRNTGEPGGGPFLVEDNKGIISRQILESSQIHNPKMLQRSEFFNPVDLVCAIRDKNGKPYRLQRFVDPQTGFISHKSKDGKELLALELPGLWNGAMAGWHTIFVEVPLRTFNPVKTVNDLLRPQHQPKNRK